jgi:hypothetical protein
VDPGADYEYDFVVANEPGTYWYHPHPHMHTGEQVYRGLAGMIHVIGDEPAGLPANELDLVLQDRTIAGDGSLVYVSTMHDSMMGFVGDTPVTNGVVGFTAGVARTPYRLRILNGSNSQTQRLTLSNGASFRVLATDGRLLERPIATSQVVLAPAQRADLWVDFAAVPDGGRVDLRSADLFTTGAPLGDLDAAARTAATFVATGPARPATLPPVLGKRAGLVARDAVNAARPKQFVLSTRRMAHWINDATWNERNVTALETVKAGSVELWEFVNRSRCPTRCTSMARRSASSPVPGNPMGLHASGSGSSPVSSRPGFATRSWCGQVNGCRSSCRSPTTWATSCITATSWSTKTQG